MAQRPKVTKISITYEVDGKSVTKDIDPSKVEALFFTDRAVKEILATFYHPDHPSKLRSKKSTPEKVIEHWETLQAASHLPAVMVKAPECSAAPWP